MSLLNQYEIMNLRSRSSVLDELIFASYLSTHPSFSSIFIKSFLGGWGTRLRQFCKESCSEPNPLKGGILLWMTGVGLSVGIVALPEQPKRLAPCSIPNSSL